MGRLEGFQLDDEVVGADALRYTINSITVFILVPADHYQETHPWAVLSSQCIVL